MDSATLRQAKIELYRLGARSSDYGIYKDDMELYYTTRAGVRYNNQTRELDNGEIYYPINITFYVRRYVNVENETIIKWDDKLWRVISCLSNQYYNDKEITAELVNE